MYFKKIIFYTPLYFLLFATTLYAENFIWKGTSWIQNGQPISASYTKDNINYLLNELNSVKSQKPILSHLYLESNREYNLGLAFKALISRMSYFHFYLYKINSSYKLDIACSFGWYSSPSQTNSASITLNSTYHCFNKCSPFNSICFKKTDAGVFFKASTNPNYGNPKIQILKIR